VGHGQLKSDETTHIPYAGKPLHSSEQVFWKVRAWDKDGKPSAWSQPASWTIGVLNESDWHAGWFGANSKPQTLLLRKEFTVRPASRRALAHVCGLGCYELSCNGRKAGDALFPPGWTKYNKTCLYDTYDIIRCCTRARTPPG
jgi:hypothetical protein